MNNFNLSDTEIKHTKDFYNEVTKEITMGINTMLSNSITDKMSIVMTNDYFDKLYSVVDATIIKLIAHKRQMLYELTGGKTKFRYLFSNIDEMHFDYDDINYIKPIVYCPITYSIPDNADEKMKKLIKDIDNDIDNLKAYLDERFFNKFVCGVKKDEFHGIDYKDSEDVICLDEFIGTLFSDKERVQKYSEEAINFYKSRNRWLLEHILSLKTPQYDETDNRAVLIASMRPVVEMKLYVSKSEL